MEPGIAGNGAGEILGAAASSGTRWMLLCPNGLITIAAVMAEGNFGGGVRCCFDEDGARTEEGRFQNGTEGGTPPMFFGECASDCELRGCGRAENKSVQAIEKKGFKWGCFSKRRGEFTYEYSLRRSMCQ
jgi:hypothetical protein